MLFSMGGDTSSDIPLGRIDRLLEVLGHSKLGQMQSWNPWLVSVLVQIEDSAQVNRGVCWAQVGKSPSA